MRIQRPITILITTSIVIALSTIFIFPENHIKDDTPQLRSTSTPLLPQATTPTTTIKHPPTRAMTSSTSVSVSSSTQSTTTPTSSTTSSREVMAWIYPGNPACGAREEFMDGRMIDILKPEYFLIREGGGLVFLTEEEAGCNGFSSKNIKEIKAYSKEQYVTIASSYARDMGLFLAEDKNKGTHTRTLVDFVVTHDLTGIELDFEDFGGWTMEDYASYKDFVKVLGSALHDNGKKLMIDGPAVSNTDEEKWFVWRYEDFTTLPVDKIVVMAYDYQFDHGSGNPIAPLKWIKDVALWTLSKYPDKERLSIGLPSYGYRSFSNSRKFSLLTYDETRAQEGFLTAKRDADSHEMTWTNKEHTYFYQDAQSMDKKRELAESLGITSVSVWHIGGNQWFTR